jgi:hypothetical protein
MDTFYRKINEGGFRGCNWDYGRWNRVIMWSKKKIEERAE